MKSADVFEWGGLRFEVMDMDGRRIDKVLVARTGIRDPGTGLSEPDEHLTGNAIAFRPCA